MLRHAIRRLLWALPTLVVVSILSFWFLSYVPDPTDDPAVIATMSAGDLGRLRREKFLDLPRFVNLAPKDVTARAATAILAIADSEEEDEVAAGELARLGGAALPHVIPALDALSPDRRSKVAVALAPVAVRMRLPGAADAADPLRAAAFWTRFWDDRSIEFRRASAHSDVSRLLRYRGAEAADDVRAARHVRARRALRRARGPRRRRLALPRPLAGRAHRRRDWRRGSHLRRRQHRRGQGLRRSVARLLERLPERLRRAQGPFARRRDDQRHPLRQVGPRRDRLPVRHERDRRARARRARRARAGDARRPLRRDPPRVCPGDPARLDLGSQARDADRPRGRLRRSRALRGADRGARGRRRADDRRQALGGLFASDRAARARARSRRRRASSAPRSPARSPRIGFGPPRRAARAGSAPSSSTASARPCSRSSPSPRSRRRWRSAAPSWSSGSSASTASAS